MAEDEPVAVAHCLECGHQAEYDSLRLLERLEKLKLIRSGATQDWQTLLELAKAFKAKIPCDACGLPRLKWKPGPLGFPGMARSRKCDRCGEAIDSERLEALPETRFCMACQNQQESPTQAALTGDYCPNCGGLLKVAVRSGRGLTRYALRCTECRYQG